MRQNWIPTAIGLLMAAPLRAQMPADSMPEHHMLMMRGMMSHIMGMCRTTDGLPVAGVRIRIVEDTQTALTDGTGRFAIGPVSTGSHVIETSRIGFRPVRRVVDLRASRDTVIELELVPAPITLDEMLIVALEDQGQRTYDLSSLMKVPPVGTANVSTVTLREIEKVHARDPWDLVRATTGLEVHEQGQGPGFASDAVIRGFTSDHSTDVALVVDGVPINEPINGHGEGYADWNLLFPAALADVQVIKGPISPLFGNFSGGGAVNVTTQASTRQTSFQAEGGSHTFGAGTVTTGFERNDWGGFFGAHGVHNSGWRDNSGYQAMQVVARGNRRVSPEFLLDAGAQYYATTWDSPGYLTLDQFDAGILTPAADPTDGGDKTRFQGRLSAVLNRSAFQWQSNVWGYQSRWHLFLTIPELGGMGEGIGSQTEEIDHRTALGAKSIAKWTAGTLELTAGAEAQHHDASYDIWSTIARRRDLTINRFDSRFLTVSGLAGSSKTFGRVLRLEAALRADLLQPRTTDRVTRLPLLAESRLLLDPKFGVVWYARGDLQFYGTASRGFRSAPRTIADPTKAPITLWAYEAGGRFSVKGLDGSLAFFRLDTHNEMVYNPITLETEETGQSLREGIETELKFRPVPQLELETHWTFNTKGHFFLADTASVMLMRNGMPVFRVADGEATANIMHDAGNMKSVTGVADYSARAGITVHPTPRFSLNAWITLMGPYVPAGEPDARTDPFSIANFQAGAWLNDHVELTFGLDNLFNTRAPEIRASGSVNPVAPRNVHVSMRTQW
ncbi:MAG: TonB-dependent receptor [Gemmatimonadetes bacterium]|nr:TonB-dependent receptor [Gemmatimonadota bacterium]